MRIAEIAEFYAPNGGGVRTYIDRKFAAAAVLGHELFVLAPGLRDGFEPRPGGGVVWIKAPALPFDANYRMFWDAAPVHAQLDRLRPDLVEASSPWRGAWIAASWAGDAPRAMFMHADPVASYPHRWLGPVSSREQIDRLFEWFWRYLHRLAARFDSVVAGGAWLAGRLQAHGVGPVEVIGLGVDRSAFSPTLRDEALRARLLAGCGLPPSAKLLLGVGRHHAEKRWPLVVSAVAGIGAELPTGLVLVGDGVDRGAVERAVGGNPHVQLVAPIRDRPLLAAMLASADALIHGCDCETFGLVAA
ncbi:MAG TPA: glycosyltransferase, partial [Caulobacteraceae bacterium]|nr:glycosyltransferase [Caulobacteraceae bacterium]